jgi:hypothetical protein
MTENLKTIGRDLSIWLCNQAFTVGIDKNEVAEKIDAAIADAKRNALLEAANLCEAWANSSTRTPVAGLTAMHLADLITEKIKEVNP